METPFHTHDGINSPRIEFKDLLGFVTSTQTLDFGAISPNSSEDLTFSLTGADIGDTILLGVANTVIADGVDCSNITFFAWVSNKNEITVRCTNSDAALTANPEPGKFKITIIKT